MLGHKGEFLDINIVYKYQHQFILKHICVLQKLIFVYLIVRMLAIYFWRKIGESSAT
jgi:hypothetical protein